MLRTPSARQIVKLSIVIALLSVACALNVLAQGVQASKVGVYAGLPGRGGHLITPRPARSAPADRGARHLLITTAEFAPDLETGWEAIARAAIDLDPRGNLDPPTPSSAIVLTETHTEGRLNTIEVHPEDLEANRPVHPGPTHHESGPPPRRA